MASIAFGQHREGRQAIPVLVAHVGAEVAQHPDDPVASEVGGRRHRRPPIAIHAARVLAWRFS